MSPNESLQPTAVHECEVRPRQDKRGVDLMFDALPFGGLWYTKPDHAIGYAREPELLNCFVFT